MSFSVHSALDNLDSLLNAHAPQPQLMIALSELNAQRPSFDRTHRSQFWRLNNAATSGPSHNADDSIPLLASMASHGGVHFPWNPPPRMIGPRTRSMAGSAPETRSIHCQELLALVDSICQDHHHLVRLQQHDANDFGPSC